MWWMGVKKEHMTPVIYYCALIYLNVYVFTAVPQSDEKNKQTIVLNLYQNNTN